MKEKVENHKHLIKHLKGSKQMDIDKALDALVSQKIITSKSKELILEALNG